MRIALAAVWPPTAEVARTAGHKPMSPLTAIRRKCLDCSCYQPGEVRQCQAIACPLWPFRAGRHPWIVERRGKPPVGDGDFGEGEAA